MHDDRLKTLKTIFIVAVAIGLLILIIYAVYGFSLLWTTFAAGITIGLLVIIIIVLIILAIYLWIKNLMNKRELKRTRDKLEITEMELSRCRAEQKKLK